MNSVDLTGRVTKDIELNATRSGYAVANFDIAVNDYKDKNGNDITYFIRIIAWGKIAENCHQYAKKGTLIGVSGKLITNTYTNKDGNKIYVTEVNARTIDFLARPKSESDTKNSDPSAPQSNPKQKQEDLATDTNQDLQKAKKSINNAETKETESGDPISSDSNASSDAPDFVDINLDNNDNNDSDFPF